MKTNWFDNFLGFFSPATKAKRLQDKLKIDFVEKTAEKRLNYDGASKGRRAKNWATSGASANSEVSSGASILRNRARDLRRNNPFAFRAIQTITANVVGNGVKTQVKMGSKKRTQDMNNLWKQWAETKAIDYEGKLNFSSIQNLVIDAVVESGECFAIRRRVVPNNKNPMPIQIEILEADFLDVTDTVRTGNNGNPVIQGIEFDKNSKKIVAYYFYKTHPGGDSNHLFGIETNSIRVEAADVIHIYRQDRPGQLRGVSWFAPIIMSLKDFDDYECAQLIKQKISACFAGFIRDMSADGDENDDEPDFGEKLEPGLIEILAPGKTIEFSNPPKVDNYKDFSDVTLHKIASGMGITYESLTGDFSQVNFSSARMGWLEMNRNIKSWQNSILISQLIDGVFEWFLEGAQLMGKNISGATSNHIAPKREMIDPTREIPAKIKAIRAGLETWNDAVMENGKDPEEQIERIKNANNLFDAAGILLDSDPRVIDGKGVAQFDETTETDQD